jgi:hypothetical protein
VAFHVPFLKRRVSEPFKAEALIPSRATARLIKDHCLIPKNVSAGWLGNMLIDKNRIAVGIDQNETRRPTRRFVGFG